jgi:histidinol-phosphate/aromatic aminotransferase/cobyric acid decarboxylase-like protein
MIRFPIEPNTGALRLDRNECITPSIIDKLLKLVNIDSIDYTQYTSTLDVIEKLSAVFDCTRSNIYVDNGSEQVLKALVQVVNCNVWVTTSPTFEMFPFYVSSLGKKIKNIHFTYTDKFSINLNNTSANTGLYLVSPHNPTGYTVNNEDIIELCGMYKYVILDQAYITPTQKIDLKTLPTNLIVVRTFSKMGGLTGMRFGFCVTNDVSIIESLNQLRPMYLNTITLKLVNKLLETPNLLEDIYIEFAKVKKLFNLKPITEAGNFILLEDTPYYKGYKLKEYIIDKKTFYRLTLCDLKTFYTL